MWILFATGMYPRGLGIRGETMNMTYGDSITAMIGSEDWVPIAEARRHDLIDAAQARDEWVNLMRWRLQRHLGYVHSYAFTMKNTGGQDLYDMIFATDHPAGDRIMSHLYGRAATEHEAMRQHALALRRDKRRKKQGIDALFELSADMLAREKVEASEIYQPEPPHEPFRLA